MDASSTPQSPPTVTSGPDAEADAAWSAAAWRVRTASSDA
jgi:hypothetical protein